MRQEPSLQRPLAGPDDVGREILLAVPVKPFRHLRVVLGPLAREHQQLLHVALGRVVEDAQDLLRGVQMRLVGGKRAVLAVAATGPRQRQRVVPAERDATTHARRGFYGRACVRSSALLLAALAVAACGGSGRSRLPTASLVLDFTPNAVHAGIYSAIAQGFDRANHVRLRVIVPSASTDGVKLLAAGRIDFAVLDIHDLAIAREHGADIVGIMALVARPLASLIAAPRFPTPTALTGQPVGITGVPSDTAVLRSVVAGSGGNPQRVHPVTIGFSAVADLLAGRVAAATAFWNDEGVTLERRRPGFHIFRVDAYGAPPYPELVLCTAASRLRRDRGLASSVVRALVAGYDFTLRHPRRSAAELDSAVPGLDPALTGAQLSALLPAFRAADGRVGGLVPATLERWAAWEKRFGIVQRRPNVAAMFDPRLVSRG